MLLLEILKVIVIAPFCFACLIFFFMMLTRYFDYSNCTRKNMTYMKYKEFLNIYYLNKDKWYYYDTFERLYYKTPTAGALRTEIFVKFNYFDRLRVKHFIKKEEENKKKQENLKNQQRNMELILTSVQKDIDSIRKQSQEELLQTNQTISEKVNNILTKEGHNNGL